MKIGLVLPGFSADEYDWCIPALLDFVRQLGMCHTVHVFALEYPYHRDSYSVYGATVHSLNGRNRGKLYAPRLWSNALAAIFSEHRRAPFDVLHAFWVNESGLIALIVARALGVPMIASVAGGELVGLNAIGYGGQLNRVERSFVTWVLKRADRITVGSRYLQAISTRWRGDAHIVPLGVNSEMFSPQRGRASLTSTKIINVASLVPVKQQEILLDAFAQLKSNSELEIIGAGERLQFLQSYAAKLGISERVKFSGKVAHDLLAAKYRAADLFVQSSLHEAQGMAVLEAAASGSAIAGTPVGILPELAAGGGASAATGSDADSLARAIECALMERHDLGCRAREIVEHKFSLQATQLRWMDLYNSLL